MWYLLHCTFALRQQLNVTKLACYLMIELIQLIPTEIEWLRGYDARQPPRCLGQYPRGRADETVPILRSGHPRRTERLPVVREPHRAGAANASNVTAGRTIEH